MTEHRIMCHCRSDRHLQSLAKRLRRDAVCTECYSDDFAHLVGILWGLHA